MASGVEKRLMRSRQKILAAAEQVFLRSGFPGATMDEVAATAGISKQTVYAHFGSKETLFIQVVESITGGASSTLEQHVGESVQDRPAEAFLLDFAQEQLAVVLTPG
ncbi:TetR/AcrR family transcriptional regulator [Microbulbifer taiwanensis]|uniref:TetR/AcrR family transcriptional regulator n=1 Tax=Microbulbifer taiwanensis TaxID=986746 RepID=UPI0036234DAA